MNIAVINFIEYPQAGDHHWNDVIVSTLRRMNHKVVEFKHRRTSRFPGVARVSKIDLDDSAKPLFERLVQYDLVIISNIFSGHTKDLTWSHAQLDIVNRLRRERVPVIGCLHNQISMYSDEAQEIILDIIQKLSVVVSSSVECFDGCEFKNELVLPFLPYQRKLADLTHRQHLRGVLMTGRISTTKGQRFLASMADLINGDIYVAGRDQMGSSRSMRMALEKNDKVGWYPCPPSSAWSSNWDATLVTGHHFTYLGAYKSADELPWNLANVHVNLTDETISRGHLEYTSIEALDAGLHAVAPVHARPDIGALQYNNVSWVDFRHRKTADPMTVADVINDALDHGTDTCMADSDVNRHNAEDYVRAMLNRI